ncbi:MAG: hypothetical protein QJT81_11340 [Candidatus Thiothrix putei]|uniref:Replication-associated protein ORF2/G2P domain-containing protein n=1 Tax=Candidatus Thiothrix putei TaxID=3080811 RepID=A0AA95KGG0_9GAMM|nr:MAG: hypothetical protein QJT81_11340 [Candidatus Thiothrix putei]
MRTVTPAGDTCNHSIDEPFQGSFYVRSLLGFPFPSSSYAAIKLPSGVTAGSSWDCVPDWAEWDDEAGGCVVPLDESQVWDCPILDAKPLPPEPSGFAVIKSKFRLDSERVLDQWLADRQIQQQAESDALLQAKQAAMVRWIPGTGIPVMSYIPRSDCVEIIDIQVGVQDVVIKHSTKNGAIKNHAGGGKRGVIKELSRQSIKRLKLTARNVPEGSFNAFLTLTYPDTFPTDGVKVKRDLDVMRKWLKRHGVGGAFWFLEFQQRGAPHFHLFISNYPLCGVKGVAEHWYKVVGSGDPKHLDWHLGKLSGRSCLEYVRKPHAASFYATKYASKQEQKQVPEGYTSVGRFWGTFGNMKPVWTFISGTGSHCVARTKVLVNNFRCSFDKRAMQGHWLHKTLASTVMWGGAAELAEIMAFVQWVPF